MAPKSKQEEALQFLDDLDSFAPPPETQTTGDANRGSGQPTGNSEGEAEVLAFIDEITQKSSEPIRPASTHLERPISRSGTPVLRKSTERVKLGGGTVTPTVQTSASSQPKVTTSTEKPATDAGSPWGWGSVWSTASAAIQQAKNVVDEQVKALPKNEQARKWGEGVIEYAKAAQLDRIGQDFKRVGLSTLTDILNVVAPPISEHEVIQVWLSHEMQGFDGIESLVYKALSRASVSDFDIILEQVEGGDLVVNRGDESRPKPTGTGRNFNAIDGYDAAAKLAQADLDELMKNHAKPITSKPSAAQVPTTYSHVFLRLQPYYTSYEDPNLSSSNEPFRPTKRHLQFLLYLSDSEHQLTCTTITQAVPGKWLDIWDEYEWVEELVAEVLRVGIEVVGQEYLVARMGWGEKGNVATKEQSQTNEGKESTAEPQKEREEDS